MKIYLKIYDKEMLDIGNPLNSCMIKLVSVSIKCQINYMIKKDLVNLKLLLYWLPIRFKPYQFNSHTLVLLYELIRI